MFWMMVVGRGVAGFGAGGEVRQFQKGSPFFIANLTISTRSAERAALKPVMKTPSFVAGVVS